MESGKKVVKDRLLNEMLGSVQDGIANGWKVLILDDLTTRVVSSALRMSDMLECNVSVVEDLYKSREPLPQPAVYFIQPTVQSVTALLADFGSRPLYPSVHIFFSSKVVATEVVEKIKKCQPLVERLKTLKELYLDFLTVDSRTVCTDNPYAIVTLMGEKCDVNKADYDREVESIAGRVSSLLVTLRDFPVIRYKAGKPVEVGDPPGQEGRSQVTSRLAMLIREKALTLQRAGTLPDRETCDVLILDRSFDVVAPVFHEWTYEAMIHDLLDVDGNTVRYKAETQTGKSEEKEMVLGENDELFLEFRHSHIADVYTGLSNKFEEFKEKNKAAKLGSGLKDKAGDLTTSNIKNLIQALPQYREILSRLSLHIYISTEIKTATNNRALTDVGELEQDLVNGEKGSKELITFLAENHAKLQPMDKMRLFMCYVATHPEKMDATKKSQWQKLARLTQSDMDAISNVGYLGVSVLKNTATSTAPKVLNFVRKPKKTVRKQREGNEDGYQLGRVDPLLMDVIEDFVGGKLPADGYPYVVPPPDDGQAAAQQGVGASARTARSALNWVKKAVGTAGGGSATEPTVSRRLIVIVVGGVVRSEMRVVHQLSKSLNRDIILCSTSIEKPGSFIDTLYKLNSLSELVRTEA